MANASTHISLELVVDTLSLDRSVTLGLLLSQTVVGASLLIGRALLGVLGLLETCDGHLAPLLVGADPQVRVNIIRSDHLRPLAMFYVKHKAQTHAALENVTVEQVVVHCLGNNLSDRVGRHFDVGIVLGGTSLFCQLVLAGAESTLTLRFRARRIRLTSPNWEK